MGLLDDWIAGMDARVARLQERLGRLEGLNSDPEPEDFREIVEQPDGSWSAGVPPTTTESADWGSESDTVC